MNTDSETWLVNFSMGWGSSIVSYWSRWLGNENGYKLPNGTDRYKTNHQRIPGEHLQWNAISYMECTLLVKTVKMMFPPCNCAHINGRGGRWRYKSYSAIQPNVVYKAKWGVFHNNAWHPLSFKEIKIRPHNCTIKYTILIQCTISYVPVHWNSYVMWINQLATNYNYHANTNTNI